jgi:lipopolysaccharide exporter
MGLDLDSGPEPPATVPPADVGGAPSMKQGVAWTTATFGLAKMMTFASTLVLARELAPSQFGLAAAVIIVLSVIELTADLGMKATIIYEQEQGTSERVDTAFTLNVIAAFALAGAGVACAPLIAGFFHAGHHVGIFRLAMVDIAITGLGTTHDGLLLRDLRFNIRIVTEIMNTSTRAIVGVVLALLGFGAVSLVWGMIAGTALWAITQWTMTRFRPRPRLDIAVARSMIAYASGASMLTVVEQLYGQIAPSAIGRVLGARALGLYSIAFRLPTFLLQNIANQVSLVAFPALSRQRLRGNDAVQASTLRLVGFQSLYSLPLAAGMAILSRPIVEVVFSSKWQQASGVMAAVSVLSGISAAIFALGDGFKAMGRQRWMVVMTLMQVPVGIALVIWVASDGITAVAWVQTAGEMLFSVLIVAAASRVLEIPVADTLRAVWPGTAAALGVVLAAGAVRYLAGLPALPDLLVGGTAGAAGAALALRVACPALWRELVELAVTVAGRLRGWLGARLAVGYVAIRKPR